MLRGIVFHIIIHQTHYEKSDWSRAFNQFTIACELVMINAISAADMLLCPSYTSMNNQFCTRNGDFLSKLFDFLNF